MTKRLILIAIILFFGIQSVTAQIWTPPISDAPDSNTPTPLNISSFLQKKEGGLIVGGLRSLSDIIANHYIIGKGIVTNNSFRFFYKSQIYGPAEGKLLVASSDANGGFSGNARWAYTSELCENCENIPFPTLPPELDPEDIEGNQNQSIPNYNNQNNLWIAPFPPPPDNNTIEPLNIGVNIQTKAGGLVLGGLRSLSDVIADLNIVSDGVIANNAFKYENIPNDIGPDKNYVLTSIDYDGNAEWAEICLGCDDEVDIASSTPSCEISVDRSSVNLHDSRPLVFNWKIKGVMDIPDFNRGSIYYPKMTVNTYHKTPDRAPGYYSQQVLVGENNQVSVGEYAGEAEWGIGGVFVQSNIYEIVASVTAYENERTPINCKTVVKVITESPSCNVVASRPATYPHDPNPIKFSWSVDNVHINDSDQTGRYSGPTQQHPKIEIKTINLNEGQAPGYVATTRSYDYAQPKSDVSSSESSSKYGGEISWDMTGYGSVVNGLYGWDNVIYQKVLAEVTAYSYDGKPVICKTEVEVIFEPPFCEVVASRPATYPHDPTLIKFNWNLKNVYINEMQDNRYQYPYNVPSHPKIEIKTKVDNPYQPPGYRYDTWRTEYAELLTNINPGWGWAPKYGGETSWDMTGYGSVVNGIYGWPTVAYKGIAGEAVAYGYDGKPITCKKEVEVVFEAPFCEITTNKSSTSIPGGPITFSWSLKNIFINEREDHRYQYQYPVPVTPKIEIKTTSRETKLESGAWIYDYAQLKTDITPGWGWAPKYGGETSWDMNIPENLIEDVGSIVSEVTYYDYDGQIKICKNVIDVTGNN